MKYICKYLLSLLAFIILNNSYSKQNIIQNIRTSDKPDKLTTRIVLDLTHKTAYSVFILDNKPRLVIDLEATESRKSFDLKSKLIEKIRINNNGKGVIRLVFDLKGRVFIDKNFYLKKDENNLFRLVLDIKLSNKLIKQSSKNNNIKIKKTFIITLDPGHGGLDPGAVRYSYREKDITLLAAKELKGLLEKKGYKVFLTRNKDEFVSLRKRRNIAKNNSSDLFISIHVDSVKKKSTRGTSIYTLSDKASDKVTAMLAERENKVDLIAGIDKEVDNEVFSILLDLQRRDTKNASASFAEIYVNKVRKNGYRSLRRPHRQAGFAVLKSPDIPSVLVELGFLSNPKDAKYLSNKKSRARVLKALSEAIVDYVKTRSKI
ncbi:MAG: N-acetylmuramoyl-L-alanine amidase [Alphaproteobacteria bacterium TMED93]|nr:MAG: N-acetylmuramoyl-L-alanine amidase [Alphaproteobacteria bacterium TMED93]